MAEETFPTVESYWGGPPDAPKLRFEIHYNKWDGLTIDLPTAILLRDRLSREIEAAEKGRQG